VGVGAANSSTRSRALTVLGVAISLVLLGAVPSRAAASGFKWLCNPQSQTPTGAETAAQADPCLESRTATVITYSGTKRKKSIEPEAPSNGAPIDCFYLYPTVNDEDRENADPEKVGEPEKLVAREQASRFSQVCDVYAPIYPQVTLNAKHPLLYAGVAYEGAKVAFEQFIEQYDDGRGFVLIGHSQGAAVLKAIIHQYIEEHPELLDKMVSALILGGQVEVPKGKLVGGSFDDVPACQSAGQIQCVIAYSSFMTEPPEKSLFVRAFWSPEWEVLCVNPTIASQDGSEGPLYPYTPTTSMPGEKKYGRPAPKATTPWIAEPGLGTARCEDRNEASWLQVNLVEMPASVRAKRQKDHELPEEEGPEEKGYYWGLHRYDVNEALGNLVGAVEQQENTYLDEG